MRSPIIFILLLLLFPAPTDPGAQSPDPGPTVTPAPGDRAGEELEEFVPSEEIKADDAISFPVDI